MPAAAVLSVYRHHVLHGRRVALLARLSKFLTCCAHMYLWTDLFIIKLLNISIIIASFRLLLRIFLSSIFSSVVFLMNSYVCDDDTRRESTTALIIRASVIRGIPNLHALHIIAQPGIQSQFIKDFKY